MARILTGIQSTGTPHLGNLLGAILPAIEMANQSEDDSFLFIADLHALTQIKDSSQTKTNTYATAAAWLACGLDPQKTVFYRQSDVPQVTELAWYLNCFFPFSRLSLAHSFKDKADQLEDINAGLFTYPMLVPKDSQSFCNRGTSGIEGSISTAVGAAVGSDRPTLTITGDLSFFYDSNALWNQYIPSNFKFSSHWG